jgi:RNA recognition motif-containing protein
VGNRLYVGNLPYSIGDDQLREAFAAHGEVTSSSVVLDRMTGRSRGFGFVEMATPEAAQKATEAMNGALLDGRPLTVNEARERTPGGRGGGPRSFERESRPGSFRDGPPGGGDRGGYRGGDRGGDRGGFGGDRGGVRGDAGGGFGGGDRDRARDRRDRDRSDRDDDRGGGRGGRGGRDRW